MTDQASRSTSIDLVTITSVVSSLQRVVGDFYGPQCTQTLLTSQTGKAVVTSDGLSIVEALQAAHPITELVFKSLKSCHAVTLDGCKTFLIHLSNFLVHLHDEISRGSFCHSGINIATNKEAVQKLGIVLARNYVRQVKQNVLPQICQALQLHSHALSSSMIQKMGREAVIKCLLWTTLMPHYSLKLCNHFAQVLVLSLAHKCENRKFKDATNFLVDNFFDINIKVPKRPYGDSTHIEPMLLDRDFSLKHDNLFTSSHLSVLIFKGHIDGNESDDDSQETILVKESGQIVNLIHARRKMVKQFAHNCQCQNIDLLICTQGVPRYSLDIFRQMNVSVIANVLERDVEVLEMLTGKLSINTVKDTVNESNIISLNGISELIIGGKKYVQLKLGNIIYPIKHLIICAPTIGLCDQLAVNLQKGLNALKMCLNAGELENKMPYIRYSSSSEHNEREGVENGSTDLTRENSNDFSDWEVKSDLEIDKKSGTDCSYNNYGNMQHHSGPQIPSVTEQFNIVEGGGAFEILFHKLLQDFTTSCTDPNLSLMCEILEKTMISLVKTLYDNTSIQSESSRGFLVVKTILQEKRNGDLWGLNRRGIPGCMSEQGVIEPLMSKIHVLHCVLNLVEQLLGIDQIVSVRKLECTKDDTE